ncbi:PilZ domain-containing protein [Longimicrobium sp.]|uniref:PilZ domain-containing protein n=1 Tax=Longimicrobium sp. TaxID=2029185 RepID=UPI003B3B636D
MQATATSADHNPRREYIRHTADVPIEVRTVDGGQASATGLNVSHGGLAFVSELCPAAGATIEIAIPDVDPPFEAHARVAWCRPENDAFLVGVEFLDRTDAFRSRMVEQVCTIERYRQQVREQEGRELSAHEAASEWIGKFAGRFPVASPAAEGAEG